jgi:hypothetical protein
MGIATHKEEVDLERGRLYAIPPTEKTIPRSRVELLLISYKDSVDVTALCRSGYGWVLIKLFCPRLRFDSLPACFFSVPRQVRPSSCCTVPPPLWLPSSMLHKKTVFQKEHCCTAASTEIWQRLPCGAVSLKILESTLRREKKACFYAFMCLQ